MLNFSDIYRNIEKNKFVLEASIYRKDKVYDVFCKNVFIKIKVENPPIITYTLKNVAFAKEFNNEVLYQCIPGSYHLDKLKTMELKKSSYEGSKPFNKMFKYLKNDLRFLNFIFKTWNLTPFKIKEDGVEYFIKVNAVHPENYFSNYNNRMANYKNEIEKNELIISSLEDEVKLLNKKVDSVKQTISKINRKNSYIEGLFNFDSYKAPLEMN